MRVQKRPVVLTDAGERVLAFAQETLSRFEILERELAELKAVGQGTLTLAASTIPGEYLLPGLLAAFRDRYPQVEVQMIISDTAQVVDRLMADEADVGVVGSAIRRHGLRLERLVGDRIVLVVPPDHPFARRQSVTVAELRGQPLILRETGSGTRSSVEAALQAVGQRLSTEDVVLTLGSTQAILRAVEQGLGIGFVSERASARSQADGRLACVALEGVDLDRDLYLAFLPLRAGDPIVAHFLDFARAHVQ
jgi:DNA-binding transcriptional LysR family regulator